MELATVFPRLSGRDRRMCCVVPSLARGSDQPCLRLAFENKTLVWDDADSPICRLYGNLDAGYRGTLGCSFGNRLAGSKDDDLRLV